MRSRERGLLVVLLLALLVAGCAEAKQTATPVVTGWDCPADPTGNPQPPLQLKVDVGSGISTKCVHTVLIAGECVVIGKAATGWAAAHVPQAACLDNTQAAAWWVASPYYVANLDCAGQKSPVLVGGSTCTRPVVGYLLINLGVEQDCTVVTQCGNGRWKASAKPVAWCGTCGTATSPSCADVVAWADVACASSSGLGVADGRWPTRGHSGPP